VEGGRRIRPAVWLIGSTLAIVVGAGLAATSAAAATAMGDATDAPACPTDFAGGCVSERAAVLEVEGYTRGSWLTGEQDGGTAWPGIVAGGIGLAIGVLGAIRAKRRAAAAAAAAMP
jgi:hypothetical protein